MFRCCKGQISAFRVILCSPSGPFIGLSGSKGYSEWTDYYPLPHPSLTIYSNFRVYLTGLLCKNPFFFSNKQYINPRASSFLIGSHPIGSYHYVTSSGKTVNKSPGRCFLYLLYNIAWAWPIIGPTLCIQPDITLTIHTVIHAVHSWMTPFNSSTKVSLSYWMGVPKLLDRNTLIVSDKNSLRCWFLLIDKLVAPTCSLFRQSRS